MNRYSIPGISQRVQGQGVPGMGSGVLAYAHDSRDELR